MESATRKKAAVIGAGFASLSAATCLAQKGFDVTIFEKNSTAGGRCRKMEKEGFVFDMGPSWYWMPDVFEKYFNIFGHTTSDFYELKKLDPAFTVIYGKNDSIDIPADFDELCTLFESIEKGSADQLKKFMIEAE